MNRIEVLNKINQAIKAKRYLEIGVKNGNCFFNIKVKRKVAVDPAFGFGKIQIAVQIFKNQNELFSRFFRGTSDSFFENQRLRKGEPKFDLIFIDGFHGYEQSYRDVENSLQLINDNGIIVLHDCKPESEKAATPAKSMEELYKKMPEDWDGIWNGDVWKTIVRLRSERKDLNVFVLDCDNGLGVVTRGKPDSILNLSLKEISELSFKDLQKDYELFLNLKPVNYLSDFLNLIRT